MSQKDENLLIDFENVNINESEKSANDSFNLIPSIEKNESVEAAKPMAFMCSSLPIYKLLDSNASDCIENNNPFDQMDKQAALLDDPFEIVENAASNAVNNQSDPVNIVEMGTLISLDSPSNSSATKPDHIQTHQNECIETTSHITTETLKTTPRRMSPKSRNKTKNNSLNLLKYSLSNSRSEAFNGSPATMSDENNSGDEAAQKTGNPKESSHKNSITDDSFDDIWSTKPNLIDSQTDIDIESDIDNDIANLNIPMLSTTVTEIKGDVATVKEANVSPEKESPENKINRNELLEKFASIKLKIPQSPKPNSTFINQMPHDQTVDINVDQTINLNGEPITPKNQYSSVPSQHVEKKSENPYSLIENLKKLVDQCDDVSKQTTAKTLLDSLSTILTSGKGNQKTENKEKPSAVCPPQPIKREGTFSIEKAEDIVKETSHHNTLSGSLADDNASETNDEPSPPSSLDPGLSQVLSQIQNVLGTNQNINVLQTNMQPIATTSADPTGLPAINPTYIVVMAQPPIDFNADDDQGPYRSRSQSLNLKERPTSALRASQNKVNQQQPIHTTPVRKPVINRRSSFGTLGRPNITKSSDLTETNVKNDPKDASIQNVKRRTSLQMQPELQSIEQQKTTNIIRRRSFQEPATRIRSPSPKTNTFNRAAPVASRLSFNSGSTLTRRKSFVNDIGTKDSPQKLKSSSYGIMKKPPAPPATRNLKIRVTQTMGGRSTAPLRAMVPMSRVAPLLMSGENVSPIEKSKNKSLITSTPRSVLPSTSALLKLKKVDTSTASVAPSESPIQKVKKDSSFVTTTRPRINTGIIQKPSAIQRRRTLSDYRINSKSSEQTDDNNAKTESNLKKATAAIANGLNKFTARRLSSIGLRRTTSKENKQPE